MIYIIAKQFDQSDVEYSSYLEDKYLGNDIQIVLVGNLGVYGEYNPVTHVSDKKTFETKINQLIEEKDKTTG